MIPAEGLDMDVDACVVIDAFRATTTIATLFDAGLRSLTACAEIDAARTLARDTGALLFGEVHGLAPAGFDYGNSPVEAAAAPVSGRDAVLFTTNGTRALTMFAPKGPVFAAAFVNARAAAAAVSGHRRVALVCAGTAGGRSFTLEDFAAAGAIVRCMRGMRGGLRLDDGARLAAITPATAALDAHHAQTLRQLGLEDDLAYSVRESILDVVPQVVEHGAGWARLGVR